MVGLSLPAGMEEVRGSGSAARPTALRLASRVFPLIHLQRIVVRRDRALLARLMR